MSTNFTAQPQKIPKTNNEFERIVSTNIKTIFLAEFSKMTQVNF